MFLIITILLATLSIVIKLTLLASRLGINILAATASVAARGNKGVKVSIRAVKGALISVLRFVGLVVDLLLWIMMMGWIGLLIGLISLVSIISGAWVVLLQSPSSPLSSANPNPITVMQQVSNPLPAETGQGVTTVGGMPGVAPTVKDLPTAMMLNAAWAMENAPKGCYRYKQGNTDYCNYDCSTWTAALTEMAGWKIVGNKIVKTTKNRYIISKNRKSDLEHYFTTGMQLANFPSVPGIYKGRSNDYSQMKPGDLLVNSGHVVMYAGLNSKGKPVISHAGRPQATTFVDIEMTKKPDNGTSYGQVGFAPYYSSGNTPWAIFRFADYTG